MPVWPSVALLDRDGTINVPAAAGEYITTAEDVELLPGAAEAVARLNREGIPVAVVTNQRGIALGQMTELDLRRIHRRLDRALALAGAHIDHYEHCPHAPGTCSCRKPQPGLLLAAARRLGARVEDAVMVGDAVSDVQAGRAVGTMTIRLGDAKVGDVADLAAAVDRIIERRRTLNGATGSR